MTISVQVPMPPFSATCRCGQKRWTVILSEEAAGQIEDLLDRYAECIPVSSSLDRKKLRIALETDLCDCHPPSGNPDVPVLALPEETQKRIEKRLDSAVRWAQFQCDKKGDESWIRELRPESTDIETWLRIHRGDKEAEEEVLAQYDRFIWSRITELLDRLPVEARNSQELQTELYQAAAGEFSRQMGRYNPFVSAPTTFFRPWIDGAIRQGLTQWLGMKPSYTKLVSRFTKAMDALIREKEMPGPRLGDIAREAGLSMKEARAAQALWVSLGGKLSLTSGGEIGSGAGRTGENEQDPGGIPVPAEKTGLDPGEKADLLRAIDAMKEPARTYIILYYLKDIPQTHIASLILEYGKPGTGSMPYHRLLGADNAEWIEISDPETVPAASSGGLPGRRIRLFLCREEAAEAAVMADLKRLFPDALVIRAPESWITSKDKESYDRARLRIRVAINRELQRVSRLITHCEVNGRVLDAEGRGCGGITLRLFNSRKEPFASVLSDSRGCFTFLVPPGWSGILMPEQDGTLFEPASRSLKNVQKRTLTKPFRMSRETHDG